MAYPTEVWYPDLLDVEAIYADARELYEGLLRRATVPDEGHRVGKILLLCAASHLLAITSPCSVRRNWPFTVPPGWARMAL